MKKHSCNGKYGCKHHCIPEHIYHYCEKYNEVLEFKKDKRFAYNTRIVPIAKCKRFIEYKEEK